MSHTFEVDLDSCLQEMFRENVSLCPYAAEHGGRILERALLPCREPFCRAFRHGRGTSLLRHLLTNEPCYENPLFFILFKGFAYGEYRFVRSFIPQNSHEERLTGHLISELANALSIVKNAFVARARTIYSKPVDLEFYYADMSSNQREKDTGADFAVIFHVDLPDYPERIRAILCQAKKLKNSARIKIKQLQDLISWADKGGYYCFYDMEPSKRIAPLIVAAGGVKKFFDQTKNITRSRA